MGIVTEAMLRGGAAMLGLWLGLCVVAIAAVEEGHPMHIALERVDRSDEDHLHLHRQLRKHHVDVLLQMDSGTGEGDRALKPVELKNWGYTQFVGTLNIGTPAQTMRVIYDTGSSNTWLPGHACNEASC